VQDLGLRPMVTRVIDMGSTISRLIIIARHDGEEFVINPLVLLLLLSVITKVIRNIYSNCFV